MSAVDEVLLHERHRRASEERRTRAMAERTKHRVLDVATSLIATARGHGAVTGEALLDRVAWLSDRLSDGWIENEAPGCCPPGGDVEEYLAKAHQAETDAAVRKMARAVLREVTGSQAWRDAWERREALDAGSRGR